MPDLPPNEPDQRKAWLDRLRNDPAMRDNPLLEAVEQLVQEGEQQLQRLNKLMRIADGYDDLKHRSQQSLLKQCDRQLRRIEKIARISDLYQRNMVDLNESLRQAALHDPLTGLPNRRHLMETFQKLGANERRKQDHYCLAMVDLDYFKRINDRYGHETGDLVLCEAARCIADCLRDVDMCGRWGGEEFLILLTDTTEDTALDVMERVRSRLESLRVEVQDSDAGAPTVIEFPVGVSIGLTRYRPGEHYDRTLSRADQAMYLAKKQGRNRVVATW